MKRNKKKQQKELLKREMNECENLTFRPQINPVSRFFGRFNQKKLEDHLIEKGKKTKDMIEKKRSEMLFEKQHQHSFRPQINKHSEKLIMERSRQFLEESAAMYSPDDNSRNQDMQASYMSANQRLDKFKLLYDDAIKRKQRKDEIYSKCLDSE